MFSSYFTAMFILATGALFCIVVSDRSDGKTFDCKVRALEEYEKDKSISVYMRRYKTEITRGLYENFFDQVIILDKYKKYATWEFKGSKYGIKVKTPNSKEWDWIVFFVPLSMSGKYKSQLDAYVKRIKIINYDEFIPLDNRYIKDEANILLEFWKSIDRDRFKVQMILLGNKITRYNPIFDFFNIETSIEREKIKTYKKGTLAIQIYGNKEHREVRQNSKFNELISGTKYEEYDTGGILNKPQFKSKSRKGFNYFASFMSEKGEGTIWIKNNEFVISKYTRKDGILITDKIYKTNRKQLTIKLSAINNRFKIAYRTGKIYFEDEKAQYLFEPIIKKGGL